MAVELGERLNKLKKEVGHGNWLPFVERHLPFTNKTAGRYIKVYKNRSLLSAKFDNVSNFRVSEAYEALTRPKVKPAESAQEHVDDPQSPPDSKRGAAEILTEIQRTVAAGVGDLPADLLEAFESDFNAFLETWIKENTPEAPE